MGICIKKLGNYNWVKSFLWQKLYTASSIDWLENYINDEIYRKILTNKSNVSQALAFYFNFLRDV